MLIGQIHAGGTKIVMTTHNLGQARRLGDALYSRDPDACCAHFPWEEKIVRCVEALLPPEEDACCALRCVTVEAYVCHGSSEARIWEV